MDLGHQRDLEIQRVSQQPLDVPTLTNRILDTRFNKIRAVSRKLEEVRHRRQQNFARALAHIDNEGAYSTTNYTRAEPPRQDRRMGGTR